MSEATDLNVIALGHAVAEEMGVVQGEGLAAVRAVLTVLGRTLAAGHRVRLNNFGIFEPGVRHTRAGLLRGPDGQDRELKAREIKIVKFRASGRLRETVQNGGDYSGLVRDVPPRGRVGRSGDRFPEGSGPADAESAA